MILHQNLDLVDCLIHLRSRTFEKYHPPDCSIRPLIEVEGSKNHCQIIVWILIEVGSIQISWKLPKCSLAMNWMSGSHLNTVELLKPDTNDPLRRIGLHKRFGK